MNELKYRTLEVSNPDYVEGENIHPKTMFIMQRGEDVMMKQSWISRPKTVTVWETYCQGNAVAHGGFRLLNLSGILPKNVEHKGLLPQPITFFKISDAREYLAEAMSRDNIARRNLEQQCKKDNWLLEFLQNRIPIIMEYRLFGQPGRLIQHIKSSTNKKNR